jgi:transposase
MRVIAATHGVTDAYISRWKHRAVAGGLPALADLPRSGRPDRLDARVEARILTTRRNYRQRRCRTGRRGGWRRWSASVT